MSMSLKIRHADEIVADMVNTLDNKEFTGLFRTASGSHEEALRDAISSEDSSRCLDLYSHYFAGGEGDTALQAELSDKYGDDQALALTKNLRTELHKICNPGPGSVMPADDKGEEECKECGDKDHETDIALAFAMNHLVKVADALDGRGFVGIASVVDEAVEKLAAKK